MDKEIRSDAKLKNLPQEVLDQLWLYRYPIDPEQDKLPYIAILALLKNEHGISSSLGALSEFYSWMRMERKMAAARSRAEQARQLMARDPDATPEAIARVGQMAFTAEMVDDGNIRAFIALEKLRLQQRIADQDERKLKMLEAKAARLDAMEAKVSELKNAGGLSPETLEFIEKQLKIL